MGTVTVSIYIFCNGTDVVHKEHIYQNLQRKIKRVASQIMQLFLSKQPVSRTVSCGRNRSDFKSNASRSHWAGTSRAQPRPTARTGPAQTPPGRAPRPVGARVPRAATLRAAVLGVRAARGRPVSVINRSALPGRCPLQH